VLLIERGGNYGWSVMEGTHPFRPDRKKGPTPILAPVVEHPHSEFRCVIGGSVYHGTRLKELAGAYIYGDFETGKVWGLRREGSRVSWHHELAASRLRIIAFGQDDAGELYVLDFQGGIHRLVPGSLLPHNESFPRKLSETGLFASVPDHQPAAGVIPYSVNAPLWSDHAFKERFIALPGLTQINYNSMKNRPFVEAPEGWGFPDGTVLVKTFSLEMERGKPASRRRIETRLLHLQKLGDSDSITDAYWRGYTYVWNDEQTDAVLVDAGGLDRSFSIRDSRAPGGSVQQTWHFPSRTECIVCHSASAKLVLGVNTLQMNKDHDYGDVRLNQLAALEQLGVFSAPLPGKPETLPHLVNYEDESLDINLRARSYLHANCAHCHILYGGGNSPFELQANLTLPQTKIVGAIPVHGSFGIADARLLAPGKPESSIIFHRMTTTASGRMPPVASTVVDEHGARLIAEWIRQVPEEKVGRSSYQLWAGAGIAGALLVCCLGGWLRKRRRMLAVSESSPT
jgi:uncharacterized repeat protein (TIGR03806 family)